MAEEIWELAYYCTASGKLPFREWFASLSDLTAQEAITVRLTRLRYGNFGKCAPIGLGLSELKINYGPGYRIYFGRTGNRVVLLLCGGDKSTQRRDVLTTHQYWQSYKEKEK